MNSKILYLGLWATLLAPHSALAQRFFDASNNLPASAGGANMDVRAADLDEDGDLDLVFAREGVPNFILRNNGTAVFTNATSGNLPQPFNDSEDVTIADFNADGHLDLIFCSEDDFVAGQVNVHEYYFGNGQGKFTAAPFKFPDSEANAVITGDLNKDGFPDVIFGNKGTLNVLINDSTGKFTLENNRVPAITRTTQDIILFDADGDGDADLMEGNENGNLLFINNGDGFFADSTATHLPMLNCETRKLAVADIDNDNDLDVYLANVNFLQTKDIQDRLLLNDGHGHFTDATANRLPKDIYHSIDAIFEDLDADGDPDMVVANVFGGPIVALMNENGVFVDSTLAVFGQLYFRDALGVIAADLNNDGCRDLYICNRKMPGSNLKDLMLLCNIPSSTADGSPDVSGLSVYPNPVSDYFFIKTPTDLVLDSVQLSDGKGQNTSVLPLTNVETGLYRCNLPSSGLVNGIWWAECRAGGKMVGVVQVVVAR